MTSRRNAGFWVGAAAVVAAMLVAGRLLPLRDWLAAFERWTAGFGPLGAVLYTAAYVPVTVVMMPAILLTLGAGFAFGLPTGFFVAWIGSTLGASVAFLVGRYAARERVARAIASRGPRYAAIDRAIGRKGARIVFLLRLSPIVPFVVSNYFYGLTAIPFGRYVLASAAGMAPLVFLYVSLGAAARQVVGDPSGPAGAWKWTLIVAGIVVTLAATLYARTIVKRAMEEGETR
jgi:uncharacterized membrane protein YdjX (TVP38/TMEM64 family)